VTPGLAQINDGLYCGSLQANEIAALPFPSEPSRTVLDVFVQPGFLSGSDGGAQPDIDADGDGLERFATDGSTGRVTVCIDGDGSRVEGADCAVDGRFADNFSFATRFRAAACRLHPPR
jgi:hypothetical protein